jgi:hypothetical protein
MSLETLILIILGFIVGVILRNLFLSGKAVPLPNQLSKEGSECDFHNWDIVYIKEDVTKEAEKMRACMKCGLLPQKEMYLSKLSLEEAILNKKTSKIIKEARENIKINLSLSTGVDDKVLNKILDAGEKLGRISINAQSFTSSELEVLESALDKAIKEGGFFDRLKG